LAAAQEEPPLLPPWPSTYAMNASTIVMACNYTGYMSANGTPESKFAVIDYDWSNALSLWSASTPMDTNERLLVQADMTKQASPDTRVWIYRNSAWAYPWYDTVRFILDDDAYSPWFLKFKPTGSTYSPRCDNNYSECTTGAPPAHHRRTGPRVLFVSASVCIAFFHTSPRARSCAFHTSPRSCARRPRAPLPSPPDPPLCTDYFHTQVRRASRVRPC
jgi:hypothetical protein